MTMFTMTNDQFQLVYDVLSFSLACMMSCTVFLWMRVPSILEKYKVAVIISGLVTFIAAYHYIRIFNSWVEAYHYPNANQMDRRILDRYLEDHRMTETQIHAEIEKNGGTHAVIDKFGVPPGFIGPPFVTGTPFNDAYRYMDWLLTVPLLLMEIVLVMKLPAEEANSKCWTLGTGSALMIVSGYKGELVLTGNLAPRWTSWCISMCFFLYIVYTLMVGLAEATNAESDPAVKTMISNAQVWTCVSWCTYPIVYIFPMLGIGGSNAVVYIQIGYCISDIISKCGVGLMIYQITIQKSNNERADKLLA